MRTFDYDVIIAGGGVTGCAIARELSRYALDICLLEKEEDVCSGTSKANSAIVHAGFDAAPGSMKAQMNVAGSRLMPDLARELDVPFRQNGSMVLCLSPDDRPALEALYRRGLTNGVEGLSLLTGEEARALEPHLTQAVAGALLASSGGIVCPFELTAALAENDWSGYAIANGNVAAVRHVDVTAPFSGTLLPFSLETGDRVAAGETLLEMLTTTLYAPEDGVLDVVFAGEGDDATAAMNRYGALAAVAPALSQQITASTAGAYDDEENRAIRMGETLYFRSAKEDKTEGYGRVVAVEGKNFVVEIQDGAFDADESLTLYRSDAYKSKEKVGKGVVTSRDPVLIQGQGRVAEWLAHPGDTVAAGQPLLTLMAADADAGASPRVAVPADGVAVSVAVSPGQQVWKGQLLARIDLTDALEIVAEVDEVDLGGLKVGDTLPITMDMDAETVINGTVTEISGCSRR